MFLSHYASGFTKGYDVIELLYQQPSSVRHLAASVDAVSLAFLYNFYSGCRSYDVKKKYSYALRVLRQSFEAPDFSTSDSTLLSVMLLDLVEKFTSNDPQSTDSWMSHINGALALVRLRDSSSFEEYTSFRLSLRLSTNLLISCVAAGIPAPPALIKLRYNLEHFLDKDDPKWRESWLIIKYAQLRADMNKGFLANSEIVERAIDLEEDLQMEMRKMPKSWLYTTVELDQPNDLLFKQCFDRYPSHTITQTWNVTRSTRIFLNQIIQQRATQEAAVSVATTKIDSLAKDICSSAPQYTVFSKNESNHPVDKMMLYYTFVWPLYNAGLSTSQVTGIRSWVIKHLRFICSQFTVHKAHDVAEILESGKDICPWSVYAMLGSYGLAA